jgi:hypothetical protein
VIVTNAEKFCKAIDADEKSKKSGPRRNWVETFVKLDARPTQRKSNGVLSEANPRKQNVRRWDQEKQKNQGVDETVCEHWRNSRTLRISAEIEANDVMVKYEVRTWYV